MRSTRQSTQVRVEKFDDRQARALVLRLMEPGFDQKMLGRSEGWWLRDPGSISFKEAVELVRGLNNQAPNLSPIWHCETVWLRDLVIKQLASSLNMSARQLLAVLKRKDRTLRVPRGPRRFAGHEYLGRFEVGRTLRIADPFYVDTYREDLIARSRAKQGFWHAYIRCDADRDQSLALLVVHSAHLNEALQVGRYFGSFVVDSGRVAVLDENPAKQQLDRAFDPLWSDGSTGDSGCLVHLPFGDGRYAARRFCVAREAVMIRLNLTGEPEHNKFSNDSVGRAMD